MSGANMSKLVAGLFLAVEAFEAMLKSPWFYIVLLLLGVLYKILRG